MFSKPDPHASQYRWFLLLAIFFSLVAVVPITQRAQRQSQKVKAPSKRKSLDAVPGEILVRFRPQSKSKQLGRHVLTEKSGRQITLSIKAVSPKFEIVEGLRIAQVNPADTSNALEALRARSDVLYAEPNLIRRAFVA